MKGIAKLLRTQLGVLKPFLDNCSLATARKGQERIGKLMAMGQRDAVDCQELAIGQMACAMLSPKDPLSPGVILYLHGGGYTAGDLEYAKGFATILATRCGVRVLCIAYRLAPEHIFPAAVQDCVEAYGYLLRRGFDPAQIILCGESAGGGLCYSLCLRAQALGWTLPAGIIAISPWTDLTLSGESYETNRNADPYMTRQRLKYYADCYVYGQVLQEKSGYPKTNPNPEDDLARKSDPLISPLFGTLTRMPPSLLFAGGDEVLLDDTLRLYQTLQASGCEAELTIAPHMWHAYVLFGLKEYDCDMERICRFVKDRIPHQKKLRWMSLDNAAKIFPAARRRNWSNVFRLSATLDEPIDRQILQSALDVTVRRFPSVAVRVRAGFFWYYLEEIPCAPQIMEEKPYPLARMPFDDIRKCAFRVIVYQNRIAVEFFHALTDGNGGMVFLKTLVAEYLEQKYGIAIPTGGGILDRLEEPSPQELEDSFQKYAGNHCASRKDTNAFRLVGRREVDGFKTNTTFIFDEAEVIRQAKAQGVTVTAYMVAALILAAGAVQEAWIKDARHWKRLKVVVPVNLRKMFPSETLRNFVLYITPGIDPRLGKYSFDEVCQLVHHQMKLQINPKNMAAMIATNVGNEKPLLLRMTPLFLKNLVMKTVFNTVGERKSCFNFSNLGVVTAPEEFSCHVKRLDFVLGVQASAPYNTSAVTYGGKLYLNVIRNIRQPVLERQLSRLFRELGLNPAVESNSRGGQ